MKSSFFGISGIFIVSLFLLLIPSIIHAEYPQAPQAYPPIAQPLIREGTLAVKLAPALGLAETSNEAEAESWLAEKGISPRNGWIADYPVTPDIYGELQKAVSDAAAQGKIPMRRAEALKQFESITSELAIAIRPADDYIITSETEGGNNMVPPAEVDNYYYDEGPPVVTYYTPPDYYYNLYSWIPYPFWYSDFWFGGFFVLNDFHRAFHTGHNHHREFVSNHFRDGSNHQFSRIDPLERFNGRPHNFSGRTNRENSVPVRSQINSGTDFTRSYSQTATGMRQRPGNMRPVSHVRGAGNRPAAFQRNYNPADHSNTSSRSYAPSTSYNSQARSYKPASSSYVPARSYAPSRSYTPSTSYTSQRNYAPSFRSGSFSSPSFRGGGGFSGGHGRR